MTDNSGGSVLLDEEDAEQLRGHVRFLVALGTDDFEGVLDECVQMFEDLQEEADEADEDAGEEFVRGLVGEAFAAHLAEQESWPEELDTDRLDRALRELSAAGLVARLDHACCQRCGIFDMDTFRDGVQRGYTFAHRQDMERAVADGSLLLAYGVFADGKPAPGSQVGIGQEIAEALRRHDLEVDWDGSSKTRIEVSLTWRRRRTGDMADWPGASE